MSFWSDMIKFIEDAVGGPAGAVASTGLPGTSIGSDITSSIPGVTVVEAIWTELTDVRMWRSLGWIVLGIILMLLGVAWWIGPSAERASPIALITEGLA